MRHRYLGEGLGATAEVIAKVQVLPTFANRLVYTLKVESTGLVLNWLWTLRGKEKSEVTHRFLNLSNWVGGGAIY